MNVDRTSYIHRSIAIHRYFTGVVMAFPDSGWLGCEVKNGKFYGNLGKPPVSLDICLYALLSNEFDYYPKR